jgi:hypothetical protein
MLEDRRVTRSLFDPVAPEQRISRRFRDVRDQKAFTAARRLMDEVFAGFPDVDRSFVQEFQTGAGAQRAAREKLAEILAGSPAGIVSDIQEMRYPAMPGDA